MHMPYEYYNDAGTRQSHCTNCRMKFHRDNSFPFSVVPDDDLVLGVLGAAATTDESKKVGTAEHRGDSYSTTQFYGELEYVSKPIVYGVGERSPELTSRNLELARIRAIDYKAGVSLYELIPDKAT